MSQTQSQTMGLEIQAPVAARQDDILSADALRFVERLAREFDPQREELLRRRALRQREFDAAVLPHFLSETEAVRQADWTVAPIPDDLQDRRVEITGPTDRKMVINALNSGASVYMADFEDANSPTWQNLVDGQGNLCDAIDGTIRFTSPEGKLYRLNKTTATLMVRPRGLHLPEKHVRLDGKPVPGVALGLRPLLLPQRPKTAGQGERSLFLPAQAGKPPGSPALERRLPHGPGRTGHPARQHSRHGADRDHSRRLRDGRDPLRAAGPFGGAELRAVGLHLQHHQEVPPASRRSPCRTGRR